MYDSSVYNPVGYELARNIYDPTTVEEGTNNVLVFLHEGERLTPAMLISLREKGIDTICIRIQPTVPDLDRIGMTEFMDILDEIRETLKKDLAGGFE